MGSGVLQLPLVKVNLSADISLNMYKLRTSYEMNDLYSFHNS